MNPQRLIQARTNRSAWDIPAKSIAQGLQRDLAGAHSPTKASYFHIHKSADVYRSQRIAKAAI